MKKLIVAFIICALLMCVGCTVFTHPSTQSSTATLTNPVNSTTTPVITPSVTTVPIDTEGYLTLPLESSNTKVSLENDTILVINGDVTIHSNEKGIVCDGNLIIRGEGTLTIISTDTAIKSKKDLIIESGNIKIQSGNDGLRADSVLTINGGNIDITAIEGIEATQVIINNGNINISASDDGINASQKDESLSVYITINGGTLNINMGQGDTDAIDSNGALYVNGGIITITAKFAFDFTTVAEYNGGTITVNGETVTEITNSMMGGSPGGQGGFPGGMPGGKPPQGGHGGY